MVSCSLLFFRSDQGKDTAGSVHSNNNLATMTIFRRLLQLLFLAYLTGNNLVASHDSNVLNVLDFGVIGDGKEDDTRAMQELLRMTSRNATIDGYPPTIIIPKFVKVRTRPLTLSSNTTLQVDGSLQGFEATPEVLMKTWPTLPPLITYNSSEDLGHIQQYKALLYANTVTNLRITGKGVIDGRGQVWWNAFQNKSANLIAGRPNLIQIVNSRNIEIDSVTLKDSPFWTVHPVLCDNVHIHDTTIRAPLYAPNVDGIDPDSCTNVMIEHNDISCGDDHVAIKAGRCGDSITPNKCTDPIWATGLYQTNNVTVRNNTCRTGMGIAVGSESSGGIRNVWIHDNVIGLCKSGHDDDESCGWGPALHLKTTMSRGGAIEGITFSDNVVYNTSSFILLDMDYQEGAKPIPPTKYPPTKVRRIIFLRNHAKGKAVTASFQCFLQDLCENIVVLFNTIDNAINATTSPYSCHGIKTWHSNGNLPQGVAKCMKNSTLPPIGLETS